MQGFIPTGITAAEICTLILDDIKFGQSQWSMKCRSSAPCHSKWFLSHLLIARCDIGVQLSVRSFVRPSVRPQFMSRCLLCSSDSWKYETLHSNYP